METLDFRCNPEIFNLFDNTGTYEHLCLIQSHTDSPGHHAYQKYESVVHRPQKWIILLYKPLIEKTAGTIDSVNSFRSVLAEDFH